MALTLDFAFEGLKFVKKKPVLILGWSLFYAVLTAAVFGIIFGMSGAAFVQLSQMSQTPEQPEDPAKVFAVFVQILPAIGIAMLVSIVGAVMFHCAIYRAMLTPAKKTPLPLHFSFGSDEWRQIGLAILLYLLFILVYIAVLIVAGLIIGLGAGIGAVVGGVGGKILIGLAVFVGVVAAFLLMVWILLRISLVGVYTFAKQKIDIGGAWKLTKGSSLSLLGGYVVLCIFLAILQVVVTCIFYGITLAVNGFDFQALAPAVNPDPATILTQLGPVFAVQMLVTVVLSVIGAVAFSGAQVEAYRVLDKPKNPIAPIIDALEDMADQDA